MMSVHAVKSLRINLVLNYSLLPTSQHAPRLLTWSQKEIVCNFLIHDFVENWALGYIPDEAPATIRQYDSCGHTRQLCGRIFVCLDAVIQFC